MTPDCDEISSRNDYNRRPWPSSLDNTIVYNNGGLEILGKFIEFEEVYDSDFL